MIQNFNRYQVFPSVGKIYDKKLKRFIEGSDNGYGYLIVSLQNDDGIWKVMMFHRAILMSYMGEGIPIGYEVNHIDEVKTNNQIKNLNLMTHRDNINFGTRTERVAKTKSKRVQAYDKQGNLVFDFPSAMEAQRQMGFKQGNITSCCNGKIKSAYGYIWKYI